MSRFVSGLNIYSLGRRFLMSWGFYLHCLSPLFWPFAPIRGSCYCYLSPRWEINILHICAKIGLPRKNRNQLSPFPPFLWPWVNFVRLVKSARGSSGGFIEAICGTARPSLPQFPAILGARLDSKLLLERKSSQLPEPLLLPIIGPSNFIQLPNVLHCNRVRWNV